jgi:hypothetical protein
LTESRAFSDTAVQHDVTQIVSIETDQGNFFSICFRLTGTRGGRFSPATDVITFFGSDPRYQQTHQSSSLENPSK